MSRVFLTALALSAFLLVACGGESSDSGDEAQPVPATARALEGRTFVSTSIEGHEFVEDTELTMEFAAKIVGVSAGCNSMSGTYEVVDGELRVEPGPETLIGCPDELHDQDSWISAFLQAGVRATLAGDLLALAAKDGDTRVTIEMVDEADESSPVGSAGYGAITDRVWNLAGVSDPSQFSFLIPDRNRPTPSMSFEDGRIMLDTGCNSGSGTIEFRGPGEPVVLAEVGPIGLTRRGCPGQAGEIERQVTRAFDARVVMTLDDGELEVVNGDPGQNMNVSLMFTAADSP